MAILTILTVTATISASAPGAKPKARKRPNRAAQKAQQRRAAFLRRKRQSRNGRRPFHGVRYCNIADRPKARQQKFWARARKLGVAREVAHLLWMGDDLGARRVLKEARRRYQVKRSLVLRTPVDSRGDEALQARPSLKPSTGRVFERGTKGKPPRNWGLTKKSQPEPSWRDFLVKAREVHRDILADLVRVVGGEPTDTVVCMAQTPPPPSPQGRQSTLQRVNGLGLPFELSEDQLTALDKMLAFAESPARGGTFTLEGYAGTGKTTLLPIFLRLLPRNIRAATAVTALSNKAARVLSEKLRGQGLRVEASTIHKLLGIKAIKQNAEIQFDRGGSCTISENLLVIVDEASMLGEVLWNHMTSYFKSIKFLFTGDPAQLPPVNETGAPCFSLADDYAKLTKVLRHGGPVLRESTLVRDLGHGTYHPAQSLSEGNNVFCYQHINWFKVISGLVSDPEKWAKFTDDPNFFRIVAWRNARVAELNTYVRQLLHVGKKLERFMVGDLVILDAPYEDLFTGDEFWVRAVNNGKVDGWNCLEITLEPVHDAKAETIVRVLAAEEASRYKQESDRLRELATQHVIPWAEYWALQELFAGLSYGYAMTVHKSQGSTFRNVLVDYSDIKLCRGLELNKLIYVAISRASKNVIMNVGTSPIYERVKPAGEIDTGPPEIPEPPVVNAQEPVVEEAPPTLPEEESVAEVGASVSIAVAPQEPAVEETQAAPINTGQPVTETTTKEETMWFVEIDVAELTFFATKTNHAGTFPVNGLEVFKKGLLGKGYKLVETQVGPEGEELKLVYAKQPPTALGGERAPADPPDQPFASGNVAQFKQTVLNFIAQRLGKLHQQYPESGMRELIVRMTEAINYSPRDAFFAAPLSDMLSMWVFEATHSKELGNRPIPVIEKEAYYLSGKCLTGRPSLIGDLDLLLSRQRLDIEGDSYRLRYPIEQVEAAILDAEGRDLYEGYRVILSEGIKSHAVLNGNFPHLGVEVEDMAAALTVHQLAPSAFSYGLPIVKAVLAEHLAEVLCQLGYSEAVAGMVSIPAGWNLPCPQMTVAKLKNMLEYISDVFSSFGIKDYEYISLSPDATEEKFTVYICGIEFAVDAQGVTLVDALNQKAIYATYMALPICHRSIREDEGALMSPHAVFAYMLAEVVLPLLVRVDRDSYRNRLVGSNVMQTYFRVAGAVNTYLRNYVSIDLRSATIGELDDAAEARNRGVVAVALNYPRSLYRDALPSEVKSGNGFSMLNVGLMKGNIYVGGGKAMPSELSVEERQNLILERAALKTLGYANTQVVHKRMLELGFCQEPFGRMTVVSQDIHGINFTGQKEAVKDFWESQGVVDVMEVAAILGCRADWTEIARETFVALSNKGAKQLKRTANFYHNGCIFISQAVQAAQTNGVFNEIKALAVKAIIANSALFGGPGMVWANKQKIQDMGIRYRTGGQVYEFSSESQLYCEGFAYEAQHYNEHSGWNSVEPVDLHVVEGRPFGLLIKHDGYEANISAEQSGQVTKIMWRWVTKFNAEVMELRLIYDKREYGAFKIRNGYKGLVAFVEPELIGKGADLVIFGDANKTMDILYSRLREAAESFVRVPRGTTVTLNGKDYDLRELLRSLNQQAGPAMGMAIEDYDRDDRLFIDFKLLAKGAYDIVGELFEAIFGQSHWFRFDGPDLVKFTAQYYGAKAEANEGWRKLVPAELKGLGYPNAVGFTDGKVNDPHSNVLVVEEGVVHHRSWVYAAKDGIDLYVPIKPEYTTVSQNVNYAPLALGPIVDPSIPTEVARELIHAGEANRTKYTLLHILRKHSLGPVAFTMGGVEVQTVTLASTDTFAGFFGEHTQMLQHKRALSRTSFVRALCNLLQTKVLCVETSRWTESGRVMANIYLPLLSSFIIGSLDDHADESSLAGNAFMFFDMWAAGESLSSPAMVKIATTISNLISKLCDGNRMQKQLTYGPTAVGAKLGALPIIPTGELWVLRGGEVHRRLKVRFGDAINNGYVMMVRAPMTRSCICKLRVVDAEQRGFVLNGVMMYTSPFGQYFNLGDFDGDGVFTYDITKYVNAGLIKQDSYESMLEFQKSLLGYDMMSPEFWGSGAPAQYYADHYDIPSYAALQKKLGMKCLDSEGRLMNPEKAHVFNRKAFELRQTGAYEQQTRYVSSSYGVEYFAQVFAEICRAMGFKDFMWLADLAPQLQSLYEVALGGYDNNMLYVAFGLMDRAYNGMKHTPHWLKIVDEDIYDRFVTGKTHYYRPTAFLKDTEYTAFTGLPFTEVLPYMQTLGFCWKDGKRDDEAIHGFINAAMLAGLAKVARKLPKPEDSTSPAAIVDQLFEDMVAVYGRDFATAVHMAQIICDTSRNKDNQRGGQLCRLVHEHMIERSAVALLFKLIMDAKQRINAPTPELNINDVIALTRYIELADVLSEQDEEFLDVPSTSGEAAAEPEDDNQGDDDEGGIAVPEPTPDKPGPAPGAAEPIEESPAGIVQEDAGSCIVQDPATVEVKSMYVQNWFSNMLPLEVPIKTDFGTFQTVENYYQAMKTLDLEQRKIIAELSPHASKRYGRRKIQLRSDWEQIKLAVMEEALRKKFAPGTKALERLLAEKGEIVEWNNWGDTYWGALATLSNDGTVIPVEPRKGCNHLGRLLMAVRDEHLAENKVTGIFDVPAQVLVNPVNCGGTWGGALSKGFIDRYPENTAALKVASEAGSVKIGQVLVTEEGGKFIVNLPTKLDANIPSRLVDIEAGLYALLAWALVNKPKSIAIPALGCGLGGLKWEDVLPVIKQVATLMGNHGIVVYLFNDRAELVTVDGVPVQYEEEIVEEEVVEPQRPTLPKLPTLKPPQANDEDEYVEYVEQDPNMPEAEVGGLFNNQ